MCCSVGLQLTYWGKYWLKSHFHWRMKWNRKFCFFYFIAYAHWLFCRMRALFLLCVVLVVSATSAYRHYSVISSEMVSLVNKANTTWTVRPFTVLFGPCPYLLIKIGIITLLYANFAPGHAELQWCWSELPERIVWDHTEWTQAAR